MQAVGLHLPGFYTWATALGSAEMRGVGISRAQLIHPVFNTCFPGSSRPGSACLSPLGQLTCRRLYHRQPHQSEKILSATSASPGPEHSNKCLDIYSSAWMLPTERSLCAAGLGRAAASPHTLFCKCTTLLTCQTAGYSALLSLPGASSATMLIFILPAAFYLRLVEKEPLRSPQKIGVRELAAISTGRMGGCVLSAGHKYSALWLATPDSWSQMVASRSKHRSGSMIHLSVESQASQAKAFSTLLLLIHKSKCLG